MADVAYVVLTIAFFVLTWLYIRACERVQGPLSLDYAAGLFLSVLLLLYLGYALLRPQKF